MAADYVNTIDADSERIANAREAMHVTRIRNPCRGAHLGELSKRIRLASQKRYVLHPYFTRAGVVCVNPSEGILSDGSLDCITVNGVDLHLTDNIDGVAREIATHGADWCQLGWVVSGSEVFNSVAITSELGNSPTSHAKIIHTDGTTHIVCKSDLVPRMYTDVIRVCIEYPLSHFIENIPPLKYESVERICDILRGDLSQPIGLPFPTDIETMSETQISLDHGPKLSLIRRGSELVVYHGYPGQYITPTEAATMITSAGVTQVSRRWRSERVSCWTSDLDRLFDESDVVLGYQVYHIAEDNQRTITMRNRSMAMKPDTRLTNIDLLIAYRVDAVLGVMGG